MTRDDIVEAGAKAIALGDGLSWDFNPEDPEDIYLANARDALTAMLPLILAGVAERLWHESYKHSLVMGEAYDEDDPRKEMIARDAGTLYGLQRATELVKEWTP